VVVVVVVVILVIAVLCHVGFVQDASSLETGSEYKGDIDVGRELAVLHCVLCDCLNISEVSVYYLYTGLHRVSSVYD